MKRWMGLLLALTLALWLPACGGDEVLPEEEEMEDAPEGGYQIAMVTDATSLGDASFNDSVWSAILDYAEENETACKYYRPAAEDTGAYLTAVEVAVGDGARIVFLPGSRFAEAAYLAQDLYPETYFVLLDAYPRSAEGESRTEANMVGIKFAEEQSGYLAGFAAVQEGYTRLGFLGGMALESVENFGYGFARGANDAAAGLGITVELRYAYSGSFENTPEARSLAAAWYAGGTEVIFAAGGAMGFSVMSAAEAVGAAVIGVSRDQSQDSEMVITSALKGLDVAVTDMLEAFYNDEFPYGESLLYTAAEGGVGLSLETSRFNNFTRDVYDSVYTSLTIGEIEIMASEDAESVMELELPNVTVVSEEASGTEGN
ncbi:MAG: BMP family ABC transporter substrate-binding protein [Bacillota bacterium]|nr:BMP family ABC transporter substrate-binding protein [Bacillota bacterium]